MNKQAKTRLIIMGMISLMLVGLVGFTLAYTNSSGREYETPIGYKIYNNTVEIWNTQDSYFFLQDSGIQMTNDPDSYWSRNVFCLGYYDGEAWVKIKCNDELSNFERSIETDNENYINATLWKDIEYGPYDLRLGVQYHLKTNDENLSISIYGKNIGIDIPWDLGFAWKIKDWEIPHEELGGDSIFINQTDYDLNGTFDLLFKNMSHTYLNESENVVTEYDSYFRAYDWTKFLRVNWNKNLNYAVKMYGDGNQSNFYVALFINAGHFNSGQEKSTTFQWKDAEGDYTGVHWDTESDGLAQMENGLCVVTDWLYFCDDADDLIYVYWQNGTLNNTINIVDTNDNCKGLGYDGTYLWSFKDGGAAASGIVYKHHMNGSQFSNFSFTVAEAKWNGPIMPDGNYLYIGDDTDKEYHKYDKDGTYIETTDTGSFGFGGGGAIHGDYLFGGYGWGAVNGTHKRYINGTFVSGWDRTADNANPRAMAVDGSYFWIWDLTDIEVYKYVSDIISPTITIAHPESKTYNYNESLSLNYTAIDLGVGVESCWFNIKNSTDDIMNISGDPAVISVNTTLVSCANITFNLTRNDNYNLTIWVNDTVGNANLSSVKFTLSLDSPGIVLNYPADNDWLDYKTNVDFNFTATDNDGLDTCELWGNWTGTWHKNYTWVGPTNATMTSTSLNLTEVVSIFNVWCNDTGNNGGFFSNNFTFGIDTTYPQINITLITTTPDISIFTFNNSVTETNPDSCWYSIWIGTTPGTNTTFICDNSTSADAGGFGTYNLYLYVNDSAGNANSTNSSFTTATAGNGGTPSGGGAPGVVTEIVEVIVVAKGVCGNGICEPDAGEAFWNCADCGGFNIDSLVKSCFAESEEEKQMCIINQAPVVFWIAVLLFVMIIFTVASKGFDKKKGKSKIYGSPKRTTSHSASSWLNKQQSWIKKWRK